MFILIFLAIKFQFIIYIGTDKNKLLLLMIVEHILIITNNYSIITHSCIQGGFITMQRKELLNTLTHNNAQINNYPVILNN